MKLFHLVISSSVTLFLYLVLNGVWGVSGTQDFRELLEYRARLDDSILQLQTRQQAMMSDLERLRQDPSRLREEAHRIGMVGAEEIRVRVPMEASSAGLPPAAGIAQKPEPRAVPRPLITGVSISLGTILLLVLTLCDFESSLQGRHPQRRRSSMNQGMRVQTASRE